MDLEALNKVSRDEALTAIRPCLDINRWVEGIVDGRPYSDVEGLIEQGRAVAKPLTQTEIDTALAHHPRIGERAAGNNAEARMSTSEQAGLGAGPSELEQALVQGNRDYEEKFGRVFLIRAAGRDRVEILSELHSRMGNDDAEELKVIAEQLRQIAVLRLKSIISS